MLSSSFDTICTLPLPSELFAQALHPTQPLLTIGLATGHVYTYRLPSADDGAAPRSSSYELSPKDDDDTSFPLPAPKRVKISTSISNSSISRRPKIGTPNIPSSLRRISNSSAASESGLGAIDTLWSTKRHKGSCRALALSHDGNTLYSAGEDGIVKIADSSTGQVLSKVALPELKRSQTDAPTVLHALSPMNVLVGTDSGTLCVYDARESGRKLDAQPVKVWTSVQGADKSDEHISSIAPVPPTAQSTSGYSHSWCCVSGSTVATVDLRKGVVARSEEQDDQLGPAVFVSGTQTGNWVDPESHGTRHADKLIVGRGDGMLGLWYRGRWTNPSVNVNVAWPASGAVESLCVLPHALDDISVPRIRSDEHFVAVGTEDGCVRFIKIGAKSDRVLSHLTVQHDVVEAPVAIGFDVTGRMVTGGGNVVKVWTMDHSGQKGMNGHTDVDTDGDSPDGDQNEDEEEGEDSSDEDDSDEPSPPKRATKEKTLTQRRKKGKSSAKRSFTFTGF